MINVENILSLIDSGEGYKVEFKVRVPSKVRELTEEICAFANANGGYLLIGVDDNGQIIGIDLENNKRSAIQDSIHEISPALHCDMYAVNIGNKTVWVIDVPSGKDKPYIFSGSIFVRDGAKFAKTSYCRRDAQLLSGVQQNIFRPHSLRLVQYLYRCGRTSDKRLSHGSTAKFVDCQQTDI